MSSRPGREGAPYLGSLLGRSPARRAGLSDPGSSFNRYVRVARSVVVSGSITQRRFD
jgi:hypothetical protein